MGDRQEMKIGIQCFPFDILDEGAEAVVANSARHLDASIILPAVTYITERHPYPTGKLPHNTKRAIYYTDGGLYFKPDPLLYAQTNVKPVLTGEPGVLDTDWLGMLKNSARRHNAEIYPWVSILNGKSAMRHREACVVDVYDKEVQGWFCPNNPDVREYARGLITDVVCNLAVVDGIFIDRIRFPEWGGSGGGIAGALTCFCKHCRDKAEQMGIGLGEIQNQLASLLKNLSQRDRALALLRPLSLVDVFKQVDALELLAEVIKLRHASVTDLVALLYGTAKTLNAEIPVWLDLWPPSYGWVFGQDFAQLNAYADAVKIFTYHKLGGGIDIVQVLEEFRSSVPSLSAEDMYGLFCDIFRFPAPREFADFREKGFGTQFVTHETARAKLELGDEVPLMAGLQIWDVPEDDVEEAVLAALKARPQGIIYYNYGWAPCENMIRARDTLKAATG